MKPSKNTPRFASTRRKILRTDWTRALTLLFIIVALGSLVLSSVFAERNSATSSGYAGPDPLKMSALEVGRSNQDSALSSGAKRVEMEPVKPKIFHGDVGRLPLVKPKIRKPRPEPKEPPGELLSTLGPDTALQPFAPAAPAPTPSSAFPGLDFANWGNGWRSEEHTPELQSRLHLVCR